MLYNRNYIDIELTIDHITAWWSQLCTLLVMKWDQSSMHSWQIIKVCSEWNTKLSGTSFHNANTSLLAALWTEHRIWFFAHHQSSTALLRSLSNSHRSQWKRYNPVWLYWLFTLLSSQLFAENSSVSGMPAHSLFCRQINKYIHK